MIFLFNEEKRSPLRRRNNKKQWLNINIDSEMQCGNTKLWLNPIKGMIVSGSEYRTINKLIVITGECVHFKSIPCLNRYI